MPSVKLDLGRFVVVRPRKDGSSRVLFELPARLRPSGWLATIPLPLTGARKGDLSDASEVARIQDDAKRLYGDYLRARAGSAPREDVEKRTLKKLVATWEVSQAYKDARPKTKRGYQQCVREMLAWAAAAGEPDPTDMTQAQAEAFLALFDDRPTTRRHVKNAFKLTMDQAIAMNWRKDNPVERIKVRVPKSVVRIWEQADLDWHVWAAAVAGEFGLAAMMQMEWEIGQRLTDACLFRRGAEWSDNEAVFRFWQSKTESYVTIPVSDYCATLIRLARLEGSLYLFTDAATGKPFTESSLSHRFAEVRAAIRPTNDNKRPLLFRALRHSCVVQLARAGCSIAEIASITGHSLGSVQSILSRYLPRDNKVAWNAQNKRGLLTKTA